jgi:hypothetical protein
MEPFSFQLRPLTNIQSDTYFLCHAEQRRHGSILTNDLRGNFSEAAFLPSPGEIKPWGNRARSVGAKEVHQELDCYVSYKSD